MWHLTELHFADKVQVDKNYDNEEATFSIRRSIVNHGTPSLRRVFHLAYHAGKG